MGRTACLRRGRTMRAPALRRCPRGELDDGVGRSVIAPAEGAPSSFCVSISKQGCRVEHCEVERIFRLRNQILGTEPRALRSPDSGDTPCRGAGSCEGH